LVGVPGTVAAQSSTAQQATAGGPTLKETLEKGLKARRPSEFAFIEHVVNKVENGQIPVTLVTSTFLWARRHPGVPFPYFERGLRERAKKAGISL
jgi:hypothetical protein